MVMSRPCPVFFVFFFFFRVVKPPRKIKLHILVYFFIYWWLCSINVRSLFDGSDIVLFFPKFLSKNIYLLLYSTVLFFYCVRHYFTFFPSLFRGMCYLCSL